MEAVREGEVEFTYGEQVIITKASGVALRAVILALGPKLLVLAPAPPEVPRVVPVAAMPHGLKI